MIPDLKGKKVTVVGLGNSGLNAALLLDSAGALVRVTERADNRDIKRSVERLEHRGIAVELGAHTLASIEGSVLVVVSPGVEDTAEPILWAAERSIPVVSEMELGYRFCKGKIIGITGTNGKSTVTTLIGEILKDAGFKTVVCGNIGNALCGEIGGITEDHWVVLEVSSFQLERIADFRPRIAVILNITDDHQDRYASFGRYYDEKMKIMRNQRDGDCLILNYDAENLRSVPGRAAKGVRTLWYSRAAEVEGAVCRGAEIYATEGMSRAVSSFGDMQLKGVHNIENVMASILAGLAAGADPGSMRGTIRRFKGLSHRFETVGAIDGIEFVDDSKGTTVDSTVRALESAAKKAVLIAGGRDKKSDYSVARETVRHKVKRLVLIGEAADEIERALGDLVPATRASTMEEAVVESFRHARDGEMVLLSPMCSSFDMFRDYKHRGDVFKEAVYRLRDERLAARKGEGSA